jgi:hypothetical protein
MCVYKTRHALLHVPLIYPYFEMLSCNESLWSFMIVTQIRSHLLLSVQ